MMEIDTRGLSCPQPLIKVKKFIETDAKSQFTVIFSNDAEGCAAFENVGRFLKTYNRAFSVSESDDIKRMEVAGSALPEVKSDNESHSFTAVIKSDVIGSSERELGRILMHSFLRTLPEVASYPSRAVFLNCGVKLAVKDSEFIPALKALEENGFELFVCGTCLDYFNLKDSLEVGKISNMLEIMTIIKESEKTICLS